MENRFNGIVLLKIPVSLRMIILKMAVIVIVKISININCFGGYYGKILPAFAR